MVVFVRHEEATPCRAAPGSPHQSYDYFGRSSPLHIGPHGFLVDYAPHRDTKAHFHTVDQFQLFFGSPGSRYQRHALPRALLHYTDAFVTYGPFSTTEQPLRFFTLRPQESSLTAYMPADRDKLCYRGRRQYHVELDALLDREHPPRGEIVVEQLIPVEDDGLAATLVVAGACEEVELANPPVRTSGTYVCVLAGEVVIDGKTYGERSLGWLAADCAPIVAGTTHAATTSLALMSYPNPPTPESQAPRAAAALAVG